MPVWNVTSVQDEPDFVLISWRVFKTEQNEFHFVGESLEGTGRVSSAILNFDPERMSGKTASGRIYHLSGEMGFSEEAEYVWSAWVVLNKVPEWSDATEEFISGIADLGCESK